MTIQKYNSVMTEFKDCNHVGTVRIMTDVYTIILNYTSKEMLSTMVDDAVYEGDRVVIPKGSAINLQESADCVYTISKVYGYAAIGINSKSSVEVVDKKLSLCEQLFLYAEESRCLAIKTNDRIASYINCILMTDKLLLLSSSFGKLTNDGKSAILKYAILNNKKLLLVHKGYCPYGDVVEFGLLVRS